MNDEIGTIYSMRRATEGDAAAIARLAADLGYPTPLDIMQARVRSLSASAEDLLFVAVDAANEPIAWIQAHSAEIIESGFRVEIVGLIVSQEVRRTGVGRSLVIEAERWAAQINAQSVVVRSNARRLESHAFYPAMGFSETKTQVVYRKFIPSQVATLPD